ncbi:MAG: TetR/AcrR family transcriptional regulator [Rhodoglobus sp.]
MSLTPKGEARRAALLDAVLRVLERDGPGAVTHRSVAREAGVPLAAATYYFADLDDLYVSALRRATEEETALLAGVDASDLRAVARLIHRWATEDRGAALAQYELMFLAMRRTALREEAHAWYAALERAIDPEGRHPAQTKVRALAIDGLLLKILWLGEPHGVDNIESALAEIVAITSATSA